MLLRSVLASVAAVFIWAVAPAVIKVHVAAIPSSYFLFVRFFISSLLFIPILGRISWRRLNLGWQFWGLLFLVSGLHFHAQMVALKLLPVSWYVIFFALTPITTLLLMRVQWTRSQASMAALAVIGSLCFLSGSLNVVSWWGMACHLVSLFGWATLTILLKRTENDLRDWQATAVCNLAAFASSILFWLADGLPVADFSGGAMMALALMCFGMPVAFYLFTFAVRRMPTIAIFNQFLEPVFGVFIGAVILHESLSSAQWLGAALILGSSLTLSLRGST